MALDNGRAFLDKQNVEGSSVFSHLVTVIDKVVQQKPNDPHGALEVLSRFLKGDSAPGQPKLIIASASHVNADYGFGTCPKSAQDFTGPFACLLDEKYDDREEKDIFEVEITGYDSYINQASLTGGVKLEVLAAPAAELLSLLATKGDKKVKGVIERKKVRGPASDMFNESMITETKDSADAVLQILKPPMAESEAKAACEIPNFPEEADMFEWAGCGFSELETYQIMCSLRKLGAELKESISASSLRLWGKVLGTNADYWVAECKADGGEGGGEEGGDDLDPNANMHVYYVTTDLTKAWTALPKVRAEHIVSARRIKKLLTGNLKAKVITHPAFPAPGLEENLLRAQIARITADTVLMIKDWKVAPEEGSDDIAPNEEFKAPSQKDIVKLESWQHQRHHLLRNGETKRAQPDEEEGIDPEDVEAVKAMERQKREYEADKPRSLLRGIWDDKDLKWAVKQTGDMASYEGKPKADGGEGDVATGPTIDSYEVTVVRCLTWPGAITVARGGQFSNIYIGNALKLGEPDFFPCAPPDIQDEPADPGEQPEPQGGGQAAAEPAGEGEGDG